MKGANTLEKDLFIQDLLLSDESDDIDTESDDAAPEQEADTIENNLEEAQITPSLRLDYKLKTMEERAELVDKIIAQTPSSNLSNRYLEILGDYIMGAISKEDKKERLYLTSNRRITIDRRETSFEGLISKFENGEDGIYNLIANDKNIIFQHKQEITPQDIENVPGLRELREAIAQVEEAGKAATGRKKYLLKKQLIEMRRDQYILKYSANPPMQVVPTMTKGVNKIDLYERRYVDENGNPQSTGLISLFNPAHISAILRNYNALKIETKGRHWDDFFYLMEDFDKLMARALAPYPQYQDLVKYKLANKSGIEIQELFQKKYGEKHSLQYFSQLWCTKIPKIIAEQEQEDYLIWWHSVEKKAPLKTCACCKQKKPANARFFSRNNTSKDGWYSWCKKCRKNKNKDK